MKYGEIELYIYILFFCWDTDWPSWMGSDSHPRYRGYLNRAIDHSDAVFVFQEKHPWNIFKAVVLHYYLFLNELDHTTEFKI